jgi:hypothetical protein
VVAKLQLTKVLQKFANQMGGPDKLARAIKLAHNGGPDKRTLERFLAEETVLGLDHLDSVHAFLRGHGLGLDTVRVFEPETLLQSLVESGRMTFYLAPIVQKVEELDGSYREYVSIWDFRAFCCIADAVNEQPTRVHIDFQTEPPRPPEADLGKIDWGKLLEADGRTYCAVGSPLVSGLSSYMLGKMFSVTDPFSPPPRGARPMPFYFSWYPRDEPPPRGRESYPSAFALTASELKLLLGEAVSDELIQGIDRKHAQAFVHNGRALEVWLDRTPHNQYGVVVAQRRETGATWLVIAGLSGPGTYACAEILSQINLALPDCLDGECSPVVYAVVQSVVETDPNKEFVDARQSRYPSFVDLTPVVWDDSD